MKTPRRITKMAELPKRKPKIKPGPTRDISNGEIQDIISAIPTDSVSLVNVARSASQAALAIAEQRRALERLRQVLAGPATTDQLSDNLGEFIDILHTQSVTCDCKGTGWVIIRDYRNNCLRAAPCRRCAMGLLNGLVIDGKRIVLRDAGER